MRNNDVTNGGRGFPVAIIRVGKLFKAGKDKVKRVYRDDGTYYYPIILDNQLRKKVELYFKSCELTGSSDGTEKYPNISLLSVYRREIILSIEEKYADISKGGRFKLVVFQQ